MSLLRILIILSIFFLQTGCVGFVSGDLEDVPDSIMIQPLDETDTASFTYRIQYTSNALDIKNEYSTAESISGWSLGIIPTRNKRRVYSQADFYKDDSLVESFHYNSQVTQYFGLLWLFIFTKSSPNMLDTDEGNGIQIEEGIYMRTIAKSVTDFDSTIDLSEFRLSR